MAWQHGLKHKRQWPMLCEQAMRRPAPAKTQPTLKTAASLSMLLQKQSASAMTLQQQLQQQLAQPHPRSDPSGNGDSPTQTVLPEWSRTLSLQPRGPTVAVTPLTSSCSRSWRPDS